MKIAVIAANGKAGRLIVEEAVNRGLDVTAVVRKENATVAQKAIVKDLFDLSSEDLKDFDVVISAFGAWGDNLPQTKQSSEHLAEILSGTPTRLLIIGGAGSLYVNKEHTMALQDTPDFPEEFKPVAAAAAEALAALRKHDDVNWTYISPAADFQAQGERTGDYIVAGEEFTTNDKGESRISYADYAIAMVDEATSEHPHIKQRISFLGK
ncbi:SDR family oxidoreductase [Bifidobacterium tsurumiense]|uniref:FMN reductase n=1 Tax=Bifidobacterium tsurumiense TaxID=356829 RepID=A0A087EDS8_9BIFI|nr:NAD(P)H-binding protein [Bifidobacterium tsurumiense]KFJ05929.1 FMN reductase [Bifidobacterium tsurumiense]MDY4677862.1 NAD(P)H-binding protein [Bifidobacterium tsurumiense]